MQRYTTLHLAPISNQAAGKPKIACEAKPDCGYTRGIQETVRPLSEFVILCADTGVLLSTERELLINCLKQKRRSARNKKRAKQKNVTFHQDERNRVVALVRPQTPTAALLTTPAIQARTRTLQVLQGPAALLTLAQAHLHRGRGIATGDGGFLQAPGREGEVFLPAQNPRGRDRAPGFGRSLQTAGVSDTYPLLSILVLGY